MYGEFNLMYDTVSYIKSNIRDRDRELGIVWVTRVDGVFERLNLVCRCIWLIPLRRICHEDTHEYNYIA